MNRWCNVVMAIACEIPKAIPQENTIGRIQNVQGILESGSEVTSMPAIHPRDRHVVLNAANDSFLQGNLSNDLSISPTELSIDPTGPMLISNVTIEGDDGESGMTDAKYTTVIKRRAKREKCVGKREQKIALVIAHK